MCRRTIYVCKAYKNEAQNELSDEIKLIPINHHTKIGHVPFKSFIIIK